MNLKKDLMLKWINKLMSCPFKLKKQEEKLNSPATKQELFRISISKYTICTRETRIVQKYLRTQFLVLMGKSFTSI